MAGESARAQYRKRLNGRLDQLDAILDRIVPPRYHHWVLGALVALTILMLTLHGWRDTLGVVLISSSVAGVVLWRLMRPTPDEASWKKGADGEKLVGELLDVGLGPEFRILHDRRVPGSRGNVDHIVVGRAGVFVLDTKNWSGTIGVSSGRLRVNDRTRNREVRKLRDRLELVRRVLASEIGRDAVEVRAVLCFVGADLSTVATRIEDVLVASSDDVVPAIKSFHRELNQEQVDWTANRLAEWFPPATEPVAAATLDEERVRLEGAGRRGGDGFDDLARTGAAEREASEHGAQRRVALRGPADSSSEDEWHQHDPGELNRLSGRYPEVMAQYPRAWAPWSDAEDADLLSALESGAKVNELAERHGRKPNSIRSRLKKLGLVG